MSFGSRFVVVLAVVGLAGAPAAPARADEQAQSDEYVVVFDGDVAGLRTSVRDEGGKLLDVNPEVGLALVRSPAADFLPGIRSHDGVTGAAYNHAVGLTDPGMLHRLASGQPRVADPVRRGLQQAVDGLTTSVGQLLTPGAALAEPLADRQWDMQMIGATAAGAHQQVTGAGVDVGIVDTGVDASHPDIAPNFDFVRSRNFTVDRPPLDGPCETPTCVDPPNVDDKGHGTHIAATIAAARNGFGMAGVAPEARIVNLRAGQDTGYFFLYETVDAIVAAGDLGLDVVNMSFYTDPWMYNCDGRDDYIQGDVTDEELAQQALTRQVVTSALEYAHDRGVTLISAAGNEHLDLSAPTRVDDLVPTHGPPRTRIVTKDCVNLPSEGPHVIMVGSVGPSGRKADYSNYGLGSVAVTAPGGWFRDGVGTPSYLTPGNLILSAYPTASAIAEGLADANGMPVDDFSVRWCNPLGVCGFYTGLQGTSMAAPHAVGVAALIIQRYGQGSPATGYQLAPDTVAALMASTARDTPCPVTGGEDYAAEGRSANWNAACLGSPQQNSLYGEGIVDATAVSR